MRKFEQLNTIRRAPLEQPDRSDTETKIKWPFLYRFCRHRESPFFRLYSFRYPEARLSLKEDSESGSFSGNARSRKTE